MPLVEPGRKAPAFSLPEQEGRTHRLHAADVLRGGRALGGR
jgi:peroxiredoxin